MFTDTCLDAQGLRLRDLCQRSIEHLWDVSSKQIHSLPLVAPDQRHEPLENVITTLILLWETYLDTFKGNTYMEPQYLIFYRLDASEDPGLQATLSDVSTSQNCEQTKNCVRLRTQAEARAIQGQLHKSLVRYISIF